MAFYEPDAVVADGDDDVAVGLHQIPFKVLGEVVNWRGHSVEQVTAVKEGVARLKEQGIESLNDC